MLLTSHKNNWIVANSLLLLAQTKYLMFVLCEHVNNNGQWLSFMNKGYGHQYASGVIEKTFDSASNEMNEWVSLKYNSIWNRRPQIEFRITSNHFNWTKYIHILIWPVNNMIPQRHSILSICKLCHRYVNPSCSVFFDEHSLTNMMWHC